MTNVKRGHLSRTINSKLDAFAQGENISAFPHLRRDIVAEQLRQRLQRPGSIHQGSSSLCGPAVLLNCIANDNPDQYLTYVIELFEYGRSRLNNLVIEPSSACRLHQINEGDMLSVDWIALASLRDSQNRLLDYANSTAKVAGITLPGTLTKWFELAGYHSILNDTSLVRSCAPEKFESLMLLDLSKYHVCLFVNATMCENSALTSSKGFFSFLRKFQKASLFPNHWVVLSQTVSMRGNSCHFSVTNWGDPHQLVHGSSTGSFNWLLKYLYGAVVVPRYQALN